MTALRFQTGGQSDIAGLFETKMVLPCGQQLNLDSMTIISRDFFFFKQPPPMITFIALGFTNLFG